MKSIYNKIILLTLLFGFLNFQCDRENINSKEIFVKDLIKIEAKDSYIVNDKLFFEVNLPRYVYEEGKNTPLDVFKTTNSTQFHLNSQIRLQKLSALNLWNDYGLDQNSYVIEKGEIYNALVLNTQNNIYEFRVGIKLPETGTYRLSLQPYLESPYLSNDSFSLRIKTSVIGYNIKDEFNNDFYQFKVN